MPKRSTRITPKIRRKAKRVIRSPESLNNSQKEEYSAEENSATKTKEKANRGGRTATKRKAVSPAKDTSSSRYSSNSSAGNESQEERAQIPKKKRHVEVNREPPKPRSKSKKSAAKRQSDMTKNVKPEKTGITSRTTAKSSRKEPRTSERIKDLNVTKKVFSKWKPLSKMTKDCIKQVMADTLPKIINSISSNKRKEVQQCLQNLEKRITVKMNKIKGPSHQTDYREIEQEAKKVEESLTLVRGQLSLIEEELQEQKRLLGIEEEKLEKLNSQPIQKMNITTKKLHPLLQKPFTPALNLPMLSEEALNLPLTKIPEKLQGKGAQRLSKTLSELSSDMDNIGISSWLDSLSQLQAIMISKK